DVGNLYAADDFDSVWRVYSPPGTNQAITTAVGMIQVTGSVGRPRLHISQSGNYIRLTWSGSFLLQSAPAVTGTYADVPSAASPYFVDPATNSRSFFRLRSN